MKNISALARIICRLKYLNFVKMQHCRWTQCIWRRHQQNVGRFVGLRAAQLRRRGLVDTAYARSLAPREIYVLSKPPTELIFLCTISISGEWKRWLRSISSTKCTPIRHPSCIVRKSWLLIAIVVWTKVHNIIALYITLNKSYTNKRGLS